MTPSDSDHGEHGPSPAGAATLLLGRITDGDSSAAEELLPLVYDQLRSMAGGYFRGSGADHTLQPTALVHEAYIKLIHARSGWNSRAHFCAIAATAMRQILMNHARAKRASKRDANRVELTVDQMATPSGASTLDLVALDSALSKLQELNPRHARIVELRFFGGLTAEEISHVIETSSRTVEREWRLIRAWLAREMNGGESA